MIIDYEKCMIVLELAWHDTAEVVRSSCIVHDLHGVGAFTPGTRQSRFKFSEG
jgi:hypothetical protein